MKPRSVLEKIPKTPCPSPGCKHPAFKSVVALRFHLRTEHPEGEKGHRDVIQSRRAAEYRAIQAAADARGYEVVHNFVREHGCPCGNSLAWHEARARDLQGGA